MSDSTSDFRRAGQPNREVGDVSPSPYSPPDAATPDPRVSGEQNAKWRKDFPIEWGQDNYVTRRDFTKFLIMISGATALGNGYFVLRKFQQAQQEFPRLEIAKRDEVQVGGVKIFRYPTEHEPALLIRLSDDEYVAYMQRCTHLTCPVLYEAHSNRIACPCHHGYFDVRTGKVLEGPPPRPLPRITLETDSQTGALYATGIESGPRGEGTETQGHV